MQLLPQNLPGGLKGSRRHQPRRGSRHGASRRVALSGYRGSNLLTKAATTSRFGPPGTG